MKEYKALFQP